MEYNLPSELVKDLNFGKKLEFLSGPKVVKTFDS